MQHRNIELYSCISSESRHFQTSIFLKTNKCHHGGPLGTEGPGQLPPLPPLNLALVRPQLAISILHSYK